MNKTDIFPSKYLSAADIPEEGMVLTIKEITVERMQDGAEKPIASFFEKGVKDMIVNVTKWNTLAKLYGDESDDWHGKRISVRPGEVKFKGEMVACIDISSRKPGETAKKPNGKPTTAKGTPEAEKAIAAAAHAHNEAEEGDDGEDPPF